MPSVLLSCSWSWTFRPVCNSTRCQWIISLVLTHAALRLLHIVQLNKHAGIRFCYPSCLHSFFVIKSFKCFSLPAGSAGMCCPTSAATIRSPSSSRRSATPASREASIFPIIDLCIACCMCRFSWGRLPGLPHLWLSGCCCACHRAKVKLWRQRPHPAPRREVPGKGESLLAGRQGQQRRRAAVLQRAGPGGRRHPEHPRPPLRAAERRRVHLPGAVLIWMSKVIYLSICDLSDLSKQLHRLVAYWVQQFTN